MRVFYGPYRALEKEFTVRAAGFAPGPGRALLVLCPSGRVAHHMRQKLAGQNGIISNVFFWTFSQLIEQLDREAPGPRLPLLPGDSLHDYLLKNLLQRPELSRYRASRGFITALRASLRDMGDALVEPDVLEEYLNTATDPVLQADAEHAAWLVRVYRAYQQQTQAVAGYRSYQAYFERALAQAESSAGLHQFAEIWIYGFYELTGRQLALFEALRKNYTLTVFWPYTAHAAFAFGRKFFETNVLGTATETVALEEDWPALAGGDALRYLFTPQAASAPPEELHITSAQDADGEVFYVAKEMLRLHEEEGLAYADMAVTARSLEPYKTLLPEVLEQNGIPLRADFTFGVAARPLGVFVLNLLSLLRGGFDRDDLLAVVSSPYFQGNGQWRYLIEESLARRDYVQWTDLVQESLKQYDPAFLPWLEAVRNGLEFLEGAHPWQTLCEAAENFLAQHTRQEAFSAADRTLWQRLMQTLHGLTRYSAAAERAGEREFLDELLAALQALPLHQVTDMPSGITAGEVTALRGQGFKVVFVLGLNEKSFPQVIREDPVLKDYYRRILRDQLGFWINQKMERFEEERLLFFCAMEAAEQKLYVSYLRADAEGKPLVPSGYLAELARAARVELNAAAVQQVSGRLSVRLQGTDFKRLTRKEMSLALAAQQAGPECYEAAGLLEEEERDALEAARELASHAGPTARDGQVRAGERIFAAQNAGGFSPSALQDLARCPMKYFLAKGLGLKEKDEALSRSELAVDARGRAYHEVLMDYYQQLYKDGLTGQLFPAALQQRLDEALAAHYTADSGKTFGIYPVVWELILQDMHDKLSAFVLQDAQQLGGYIPSVFETYFEKMYSPAPQLHIQLKGIIDRIDIDPVRRTFRVMDYKSGRHGGKDLAADMFKYVILQPFIYLLLAADTPQTRGLQPDGAALLNINKGYGRQELTQAGFDAVRERAAAWVALLMQGVRAGSFFVSPGEHCTYCPYGAICRKDAFRTLLRVRRAPLVQKWQEVRQ